ncbi:hypothetical protein CT676_41750 [Bradyrhizobium sp. MOS001]|nr:hypothetical protein CT676_41750 [Bradyrhizobium sp. MOS001]
MKMRMMKRPCHPTLRHCEELLRRSNPDCLRRGILDCFAALAMTMLRQLRAKTPVLHPGRSASGMRESAC